MSRHGECVKCGAELVTPWECAACGWKARKPSTERAKQAPAFPLGYQQCEWIADGERCRYPGSMSTNTHEGGPYFCRLHFCCDDPAFGAQVVEASRDYHRETEQEKLVAHNERARAFLVERGLERQPGESSIAWRKRLIFWMRSQTVAKSFKDVEAA